MYCGTNTIKAKLTRTTIHYNTILKTANVAIARLDPLCVIFEEVCGIWRNWRGAERVADVDFLIKSRDQPGKGYRFKRRENAMTSPEKTPFLFAQVDKKILDGHGLDGAGALWEALGRMVVFGSASQKNLDQCSEFLQPPVAPQFPQLQNIPDIIFPQEGEAVDDGVIKR